MSLIMVPYFRLTNNCSELDQRYRVDTKPNFPPEDEEKCEIPGWKKKNNSFHDMKILMCARKHVHVSVHRPFSIRTAKERKFSGSRKCDRAKGKEIHMVSQRIYHQFLPIYPLTPIGKNKKDIKLKELKIRRI